MRSLADTLPGGFVFTAPKNVSQRHVTDNTNQEDRALAHNLPQDLPMPANDTIGWRTLETRPGHYDFTPLADLCEKSNAAQDGVILDLLNFEWPHYLDITRREFVDAFADFAEATVQFLADRAPLNITIIPVQQISLLAAASGDFALLPPYLRSMGGLVQRQLVKAAIRASKFVRAKLPGANLLSIEPILDAFEEQPSASAAVARQQHVRTLEIFDMLTGRLCPELGGSPDYLNIICVRFLECHPWLDRPRPRGHRAELFLSQQTLHHKSFHQALVEIHQRYGRPLLVARGPAEHGAGAAWTQFVDQEMAAALNLKIPIVGVNFHPEDKSLQALAAVLDRQQAFSKTVPIYFTQSDS